MLSSYFVIGAFAGMLSGLLGVGGGIVIVPALFAIFLHHQAVPQAMVMQMAIGTSLAVMIVTLGSGLYMHNKRHAVMWPLVRKVLPALIVGTVVGAIVAHFLPSHFLSTFFGVFLAAIGVRLLFVKQVNKKVNKPLSEVFILGFAAIIGGLSSLLGIGGGTLLVPFFLHCRLDVREAMGTSTACGVTIAFVATISFMVTGWFSVTHLPFSTGYIYWPAFLGIAAASILFTPLGVAIAHKLPKSILQRVFAIFLVIMACDMIFLSS